MAIVYQHRRLDTNEIFYIGIGLNKTRSNSKDNRNQYWHNIVNSCGYIIEIIHKGVSWEIACELEKKYIKHYGRKDLGLGPLVNMTDGGEGTIGKKQNMETRKKISESKIGKKQSEETIRKKRFIFKGQNNPMFGKKQTVETRKKISESKTGKKQSEESRKKMSISRMGKNNAMFGKKQSDEHRRKNGEGHKKKVIQLDKNNNFIKIWDGAIDAQKELNIHSSNIIGVCKNKLKTAGGFKWKYYED